MKRATYNAALLVVPNMIAVAMALSVAADHNPPRRPTLELRGPTNSDETKVPIVINEEINCWTVGWISSVSQALFLRWYTNVNVPRLEFRRVVAIDFKEARHSSHHQYTRLAVNVGSITHERKPPTRA
jgi:hypothetical protein